MQTRSWCLINYPFTCECTVRSRGLKNWNFLNLINRHQKRGERAREGEKWKKKVWTWKFNENEFKESTLKKELSRFDLVEANWRWVSSLVRSCRWIRIMSSLNCKWLIANKFGGISRAQTTCLKRVGNWFRWDESSFVVTCFVIRWFSLSSRHSLRDFDFTKIFHFIFFHFQFFSRQFHGQFPFTRLINFYGNLVALPKAHCALFEQSNRELVDSIFSPKNQLKMSPKSKFWIFFPLNQNVEKVRESPAKYVPERYLQIFRPQYLSPTEALILESRKISLAIKQPSHSPWDYPRTSFRTYSIVEDKLYRLQNNTLCYLMDKETH